MIRLGINDRFFKITGDPNYLMQKIGLSVDNICNEIKKLMESEEKDNISNNDSAGDSSLEDSIIKILNEN
mgnify:CR=1 FL=1